MDKLPRRLEQDKKRSRDDADRMKHRVDLIGCVGVGFLIFVSIFFIALIVFSLIFLCE